MTPPSDAVAPKMTLIQRMAMAVIEIGKDLAYSVTPDEQEHIYAVIERLVQSQRIDAAQAQREADAKLLCGGCSRNVPQRPGIPFTHQEASGSYYPCDATVIFDAPLITEHGR